MTEECWLLASPGTGPHVRQAALALDEAGVLGTLLVPIARQALDRPTNLLRRIGMGRRLLERRDVPEVRPDRIRTRAWPELLRLASARLDSDGRATDAIWAWTARDFATHAAELATPPISAVYGYESSALELFAHASTRGLKCVLEVNSCDPGTTARAFGSGATSAPESSYSRRLRRLEPARARRKAEEWRLADVVVVNSRVTLDSMRAAGRDTSKAVVVPLGAGAPGTSTRHDPQPGAPLRGIWIGAFAPHKGAHILVEALRALDVSLEIDVFGPKFVPDSSIGLVAGKLRFVGAVSQPYLFEQLPRYDVLVHPTLGDGFGMAVTEALAHGVPVITTAAAGASEFVVPGESGWVLHPGDPQALSEALRAAASDRESLAAMREHAVQSALRWQWHDYRAALRDALGIRRPE